MLRFIKATGAGNDFIIIDNRGNRITRPEETARILCRRRISIGADGLLLLENSARADTFRMRIINSDGSEAEMCGNGLRCFLLYLVRENLAPAEQTITVETEAGLRGGRVGKPDSPISRATVTASLGIPGGLRLNLPLDVDGTRLTAHFVNTGVPHAVIEVEDMAATPVAELGRRIRFHPDFAPAGTNVDFVRVTGNGVRIRTYERGVEGETLSCGTGSVAAGFILSRLGRVRLPVQVTAASGEILTVSENQDEVLLSGETRLVYEGVLPD